VIRCPDDEEVPTRHRNSKLGELETPRVSKTLILNIPGKYSPRLDEINVSLPGDCGQQKMGADKSRGKYRTAAGT
jgi:hypothetical protein